MGHKIDTEILPAEVPEQKLWRAVIDRAVKDYVFFYRTTLGFSEQFPKSDLQTIKSCVKNSGYKYKSLDWFLFAESAPYNLQYIVEEFYELEGFVERLRAVAIKDFKDEQKQVFSSEYATSMIEKFKREITKWEEEKKETHPFRVLFF